MCAASVIQSNNWTRNVNNLQPSIDRVTITLQVHMLSFYRGSMSILNGCCIYQLDTSLLCALMRVKRRNMFLMGENNLAYAQSYCLDRVLLLAACHRIKFAQSPASIIILSGLVWC